MCGCSGCGAFGSDLAPSAEAHRRLRRVALTRTSADRDEVEALFINRTHRKVFYGQVGKPFPFLDPTANHDGEARKEPVDPNPRKPVA